MFIEAIPNGNTRQYIEDALMYSWQYAAELHLPASSLDALAAGRYPRLVRAGEDARRANGAPAPESGLLRASERHAAPPCIETSRIATHIAARKEVWR